MGQYGIEIESAMPYSRMVATHPWFNIQMKDGAAEKFRFRGWDPKTIRQVYGYIKEKYPHIETRAETWAV